MSFLLQVWVLACSLHVWAMSHLSSVNDLMGSYIIFNDLPCLLLQVWVLRQLILSTVMDCDSCRCLPLIFSCCRCLIINYMFYFSIIYHCQWLQPWHSCMSSAGAPRLFITQLTSSWAVRSAYPSIHNRILVQERHISLPSL